MRILVLDESLELSGLVGRLAGLRGWEPHFVGSLHEVAVAMQAHGQPGLMLVNLRAPLTAWQLGQQLRGLGLAGPAVVVVEAGAEGLQALTSLRGVECVERPGPAGALEAAVERALGRLGLGGGGGSLVSSLIREKTQKPVAILCLAVALLAAVLSQIFGRIFALGLAPRFAAAVMLVPLGFLMGFPFPLGIRLVSSHGLGRQVTFLWGVNGVASVLGSALAMIVGILVGFTEALVLGAVLYGGAAVLFFILPAVGNKRMHRGVRGAAFALAPPQGYILRAAPTFTGGLSLERWRKSMASDKNLANDPVCGMTVDPQKAAATRTFEGKTFYFCSPGCAKQFDADPHSYAHQGA